MEITKITAESEKTAVTEETKMPTPEELEREYAYMMAETVISKMLETGLITDEERHLLIFSITEKLKPEMAPLMPVNR